jgi:two-component system, NtrC family, response regulator HydG
MGKDVSALPVVVVDDEPHILTGTRLALRGGGVGVVKTIVDSRALLPFLAENGARLILLDLIMPHCSGRELLPRLVRDYPEIPVIVMTATDQLETAVSCMKAGAFDYLVKPVEKSRLLASVRTALELSDLRREVSSLTHRFLDGQLEHSAVFAPIITGSAKMTAIFQYLEVVANSPQPILIHGETGTGKELIARAIHGASGRTGRFVAVNLAGLDDQLFSDSLFGHVRGAFTGADKAREGLLASAAHGTLFLDEIGDLQESSQVKLLRLLQEREYYPVGSDNLVKSHARIVAATNRNLVDQVTAGRFRNDLYFRLRAHQVRLPPLRERREDLSLLVDHLLGRAASALGRPVPAVPATLLSLLAAYEFPGNIRELEALLFDAVAHSRAGTLSLEPFGFLGSLVGDVPAEPATKPLDPCLQSLFGGFPTLKAAEALLIQEALRRTGGRQGAAAQLLGLTRQALNKRLKRSY